MLDIILDDNQAAILRSRGVPLKTVHTIDENYKPKDELEVTLIKAFKAHNRSKLQQPDGINPTVDFKLTSKAPMPNTKKRKEAQQINGSNFSKFTIIPSELHNITRFGSFDYTAGLAMSSEYKARPNHEISKKEVVDILKAEFKDLSNKQRSGILSRLRKNGILVGAKQSDDIFTG